MNAILTDTRFRTLCEHRLYQNQLSLVRLRSKGSTSPDLLRENRLLRHLLKTLPVRIKKIERREHWVV